MQNDNVLWVDKYNPTCIDDLILEESQKEFFKNIVKSGNMSNIILAGSAGKGKCLDYDEEIEIYVNKSLYKILNT